MLYVVLLREKGDVIWEANLEVFDSIDEAKQWITETIEVNRYKGTNYYDYLISLITPKLTVDASPVVFVPVKKTRRVVKKTPKKATKKA